MKDLSFSVLLDHYGCLLPDKQRRIAEDYFNEDLSLSEISENTGISRQGVHESVKRTQQALLFYEERLHLAKTVRELRAAAANRDLDAFCTITENL